MIFSAQCAAVDEALNLFFQDINKPADLVLRSFLKKNRYIGSHDRRKISSIFYGILRHYFRLSFLLHHINLPISSHWLIFIYLIEQEKKTVEELEESLHTTSKYQWNAFSKINKETLKNLEKKLDEIKTQKSLSTELTYGISDELLNTLKDNLDNASLKIFLSTLKEEAPIDIRVNPIKENRKNILKILEEENWLIKPTVFSPYGLRLEHRYPITATKWFKEGKIEIQDENAQILSYLAASNNPKKILDYCSGAGGKALLIGAILENKGQIFLTDIHDKKLKEASKRFKRSGLSNHSIKNLQTCQNWIKRQKNTFDTVLVDVPCSGTGTWRRHVDAKFKFTQNMLDEILKKQATILEKAQKLVKPGGVLIYATCSILKKENEDQIDTFLKKYGDFSSIPAQDFIDIDLPEEYFSGHNLKTLPRHNEGDGFFGAVLRKTSG